MSQIYFSSDHHFFHNNVIKYCNRPYSSVEEMNQDFIQKWNSVVKPEDTVWYLGDFSLGKNAVREITPRLNGSKHLVVGNHDWAHPCQYKKNETKKAKFEALYLEHGFLSVQTQNKMTIANREVLLHHMPYAGTGDHTYEERYTEYRPANKGGWLLCGHIHNLWKQKDKMINVGCDVWDYKPVSINEIESLITKESK